MVTAASYASLSINSWSIIVAVIAMVAAAAEPTDVSIVPHLQLVDGWDDAASRDAASISLDNVISAVGLQRKQLADQL